MSFCFSRNGLLPRVDDEEFQWSRPDFGDSDDPIADSVTWIGDIATQMHYVVSAFVRGVAVVPPWIMYSTPLPVIAFPVFAQRPMRS